MTLQQAFEEARTRLQIEFGTDADDYLEDAADVSYTTDDHKYRETDAMRDGFKICQSFAAVGLEVELFEATLQAAHYEHAKDCYFVVGVDEADAVRRFNEAVDSLI